MDGKKYCTTCRSIQPEAGGEWLTGRARRWRCAACKAKAKAVQAAKESA